MAATNAPATPPAPLDRPTAVRFIVCLGVVSLFADMTYEGAHSILGPFLSELGASATQVGIIAGVGEMLAASLRLFSGRLADRTQRYWTIAITGYALNLVVVPALAFVGSWQAAALLVAAERAGKSFRGPARDVLLSEATEVVGHGFGFGVHAAFDQAGAVIGPLIMAAIVAQTNHFAPAFLSLGLPALGAVLALTFAYRIRPVQAVAPSSKADGPLPRVFWIYVAAAGVLAAGFIDFPLLAYHFQKTAIIAPAAIPLLYALAMAAVGLTALVCGWLFDRYGLTVLALGIVVSLAALPLGFLGGRAGALASAVCWGVGLGVQDATLRSGIAQVVSMHKRGSAFGAFNAVYGVMWFAGSAAMGAMYDHSIAWLVAFGVGAQLLAAAAFLWLRRPLAAARHA